MMRVVSVHSHGPLQYDGASITSTPSAKGYNPFNKRQGKCVEKLQGHGDNSVNYMILPYVHKEECYVARMLLGMRRKQVILLVIEAKRISNLLSDREVVVATPKRRLLAVV